MKIFLIALLIALPASASDKLKPGASDCCNCIAACAKGPRECAKCACKPGSCR